jgi:hypothetical protein
MLLGSDHVITLPVKTLAQKQGRFLALEYAFCPQKDAFKKNGTAVQWVAFS